jgi:hypothetical protein
MYVYMYIYVCIYLCIYVVYVGKCIKQKTKLNNIYNKCLEIWKNTCTLAPAVELKMTIQSHKM